MRSPLAAACAAMLLTACAGQTPQLSEGKAIAGLWASLQAASEAADTAARLGQLKGPAAASVAAELNTATTLITAADAAYRANPAADQTTAILQATVLLSQVLCVVQPTAACPPPKAS